MIELQYWNGKEWVDCGEWADEKLAWISLGGDDLDYRTFNKATGETLTDKRV